MSEAPVGPLVLVRPARAEEFAEIGELTVRAYADGGHSDPGYDQWLRDAAGRAAAGTLLVAKLAGRVVGTVALFAPGSAFAEISRPGETEIRMLAVDPPARRQGVGRTLTLASVDIARAAGSERLVLCSAEAMTAAHRMYEGLGFVRRTDRDWYPEPGFRLVAYTLDIADQVTSAYGPAP